MRDYLAMEAAAANNPRMNDVRVEIGGDFVSLRFEFGLWLKKDGLKIGAPNVESEFQYPTGYDFVYDFTQAVDGKVHYKQRDVSISMVCLRPKEQWESIRSRLENTMQGQWLRFFFSKNPDVIREGQFSVELTPGEYTAAVEINVVCTP